MPQTPESISASLDPPLDIAVKLFLEHGERADFIRDVLYEEFFGQEPETIDEHRVLKELTQKKIDALDDEIADLEERLKNKRRIREQYREYLENLESMEKEVAEREAKEEINRLDEAEPVNK